MTLDQQQRIAITLDEPLVAVPAGPGSGKTRVLTERARYLSNNTLGLHKDGWSGQPRIVILTFTNGAAHEIRSRLDGMTIVEFVGTLHSWCLKLLQTYGYLMGYRPGAIAILPESERNRVLFDVRERLGVNVTDKKLLERHKDAELIWKEYDFALKRAGLVDYDRILKDAARLLNFDKVRESIGTIDDLLIDEVQDSAIIDWLIYSKIPALNRFYVGDPDQSVFDFRGAYPAGFVEMAKMAHVVRLENNYRSDRQICRCANLLIAHNKVRVEKATVSVSEEFGAVEARGFDNSFAELEDIAAGIRREGLSDTSIAVLCRTNQEAKRCVEYLNVAGIPFVDHAPRKLPPDWTRTLLLLGIAINPANDILVEQFLRLDLHAHHVNKLKLLSMTTGRTLYETSQKPVRCEMAWCMADMDSLAGYLHGNGVSDATVSSVRSRTGLLPFDASLSDLLADLLAHAEAPALTEETGKVFVGTIHSAKGKEFDVVFLPAFEEGIIPHPKPVPSVWNASVLMSEQIEEERRLAFVAITRARRKVFISYAKSRKHQWGVVNNAPSRFIVEMGL